MPLVQASLKSAIKSALEDGQNGKDKEDGVPPRIHSKVAKALASAYHDYAGQALAGPLSPSVPGQKSVLETPFAAPSFAGVGPAVLLYWTPIMFAGPGFIPANPVIPAALSGIAPEIAAVVAGTKPDNIDAFAGKLATILHTYTSQVMVLATTVPPASAVSTIPVM